MKELINEILIKIKEYNKVAIFRHVSPDPDSYGSQAGLKSIIVNSFPNKKVSLFGTQSERLSYIAKMDNDFNVDKDTLAIVLDVSNKERVDNLSFENAGFIIKIDHHKPFTEKFENITWVDTGYASCSEMILDIYLNNKEELEISDDGIRGLYTGIVGDTGRFMYMENPTGLYKKLGELTFNFNAKEIYSRMYKRSREELKFLAYIYENYKVTENGVAYLKVSNSDLKRYGFTEAIDAARRVNALADTEGIINWLFFAQKENGQIMSEFRSSGPRVNDIAFKFGGGGHFLAAGATLESFEVVDKIINEFDENCRAFNKSLLNKEN
ncbi:bifunctional oligoribonuclease/PAP phosphatase NrnA [uncultured Clostridium sp.]|uniref:DHH family phosphoesterase n=1 Tax=uncultured Clostridium sp. TaxID=59620 RepID=UPI002637FE28|nr:bifunctional oligoribonuclease/PAP phosphatase NrnA [uncultured Clostridium sp.]